MDTEHITAIEPEALPLVLARAEARRLNHEVAGPEHLLLGLLADDGGGAAMILNGLNVGLETARMEVASLDPRREAVPNHDIALSPALRTVVDLAPLEARLLGPHTEYSHHLLAALMSQCGVRAKFVLLKLHVEESDVRRELGIVAAGGPMMLTRPVNEGQAAAS